MDNKNNALPRNAEYLKMKITVHRILENGDIGLSGKFDAEHKKGVLDELQTFGLHVPFATFCRHINSENRYTAILKSSTRKDKYIHAYLVDVRVVE